MKTQNLGSFLPLVGLLAACSSASSDREGETMTGGTLSTTGGAGDGIGGATETGGSDTGGSDTGLGGASSTGGRDEGAGGTSPSGGGLATGGATTTGGHPATGGAPSTGGSATGGSATGGAGTGGLPATGGAETGGAPTTGGAETGGGGNAPYQPCPPDGSPCRVMPLGDSITWGVGDEGNGGYRGPLFASIVAAGQNVTFTGSLTNGPGTVSGQPFPQRNEGHSGWGISRVTPYSGGNAGIATVIPSPGFDSGSGGVPHIILLHIGTNDQGSLSAEEMAGDLAGFLDQLIVNAPDSFVVVAQIIPLGYGTNAAIQTYNDAIPDIVAERASAGSHITTVDMYTDFLPSTMLDADSIHPNAAGYQFMADRWYSVIGPLLPQ